MMSWPGNDMTDEGNGVYSASIPDGATKVIFTKGDDSGKTPDLDLQAGRQARYTTTAGRTTTADNNLK